MNLSEGTSSTPLHAPSVYTASTPTKYYTLVVLLASDASSSEESTKKMASYLVELNSFKSAAYLHYS